MSKKSTVKKVSQRNVKKASGAGKPGEQAAIPARGLSRPTRHPVAERVSIDEAGRVVVPAKIRKTLGIKGGQELSISLEDDVIKLQTLQTAIQRVQALARRKRTANGSVVDEFLAERRKEAAKE